MAKKAIETSKAPGAVGPYSQGIRAGNLVFVSGQLPANAEGVLVIDDIAAATRHSLENVRAVLNAAGAQMSDVVKATVFLTDMGDFSAMNKVYGEFFSDPFPARACIEVAALPKGARVEIEVIALLRG
ncbi:MAG: RidA family protein [Candidatus Bipolaricaulota bacterium]|nr:RidA family protein [Candidatus Bipolaricaulota bacterium]